MPCQRGVRDGTERERGGGIVMRMVITGSSGLIGSALRSSLEADGHEVIRLVRRQPAGPGELAWDPAAAPQPRLIDCADVVVNLAGVSLSMRRWTPRYRQALRRSRTVAAQNVAAMGGGRCRSAPGADLRLRHSVLRSGPWR